MLRYDIIFPPPEQLAIRRKQLDEAGLQAWLSPILVLSTIYAGRLLLARAPAVEGGLVPKQPAPLVVLTRRTKWFLNSTYLPEFGPLHVQVAGAVYLSWLLFLIFRNTGKDYLHLTKAFGHVAVSQLPFQYLLAFKTPMSPITLATGLTHERLNAYHRLFGRIVPSLLATHAILYIRFFLVKNLLQKRIQDRDVKLGIIAFWLVNFLGISALPVVRKKLYHKLFYRSHVVISGLLVVVLFFHVPYTRAYVLQAGAFWLANGYFRTRATEKTTVRCEALKGTQLLRATFDVDKDGLLADWTPGQHVYLSRGLLGPRNPFTIVGATKGSSERHMKMTLVARNLGGPQTAALTRSVNNTEGAEISVEGPYGEASEYMHQLSEDAKSTGQILLIAGGVGATYAVPIYQHLLHSRGNTAGIKLIWLVKSSDDAKWGVEMLRQTTSAVNVQLCITQKSRPNHDLSSTSKGITSIETESRSQVRALIQSVIARSTEPKNGSLVSNVKRDPRKEKRSYDKLTVLLCGPPSLSQTVRSEVGKHVIGYGKDVDWYEEQFGFGGS